MTTAFAKSVVNTNKKRKAQEPAESTKADIFRWNHQLIETLLKSRSEHHQFFLDAKNKAKLNQGWSKIVLDITIGCGVAPTMAQVKNKYQSLQALYRKTCQDDSRTGNPEPTPKPAVWGAMVSHFGGRQGISHDCLNSEPSQQLAAISGNQSEKSDSEDDLPVPPKKANRQRVTPERADRTSAIMCLGDSIKEGLTCLGASFGNESGGSTNMDRLLAVHTELLQENKAQTAELLKLAKSALDFFYQKSK